jgi:NAD-dependent dihydropyrimidine dehydrogenase PreA subunit
MSRLTYIRDVVTLKLHADRCTGCTMCTIVCPHGVFEMHDGTAALTDKDACIECGACALNCPAEAIEVEAGVGCATAVILGAVRGTEPTCDCGPKSDKPCCQ